MLWLAGRLPPPTAASANKLPQAFELVEGLLCCVFRKVAVSWLYYPSASYSAAKGALKTILAGKRNAWSSPSLISTFKPTKELLRLKRDFKSGWRNRGAPVVLSLISPFVGFIIHPIMTPEYTLELVADKVFSTLTHFSCVCLDFKALHTTFEQTGTSRQQ